MRRLRVQLTVLLALLGLLLLAWGAAIFLGARDAARSNVSLQSTVERVDLLRRAVTGLSRDFVTMETSRRAYLLTGDKTAQRAHIRAEVDADGTFKRVRALSRRWQGLSPLVEQVANEYRAWVRTGHTELKAKQLHGTMAAAQVARRGNADQHFQTLWARQTDLEDQLAGSQRAYARSQDRTYEAAQTLAVRTALMMLAALVLIAVWLRRAVGAPADALRAASGRLAGGDLETPVTLGVENELGAVASDLETMRRRLAGRMEALERLRHLSAQVVGATSLQRLAEVALAGLQPEVGVTRALLGPPAPSATFTCGPGPGSPTPAWPTTSSRPTSRSARSCPCSACAPARSWAWPTWTRWPAGPRSCGTWWPGWGSAPWPWSRCCPGAASSACSPCAGPSATGWTASRRPCSAWPATRSRARWRPPCAWRRRSGRPARPGRCSTPSPTGCC
jgi:CHASE3 domain sensor protein